MDAKVDGPPDSGPPARPKYDVAYVNDLTVTPASSTVFSLMLVINKGTAPLDLSNITVVTHTNDFPGIVWDFEQKATTAIKLKPDRAAGFLDTSAAAKLVDSGLVPEPIEDNLLNFELSFATQPPAGVTVHAQAVLQIESVNIVLPFTIKVVSTGFPTFNTAGRISSQP